ncbi:MAG: nucleotidyl transferase AbiEii/AbiGii toxin family protein [Actinobacteria bacterium]|nr:nucleotidyl transferase AbiEii/AbiGii toxin family protein [Actinomycetota bacterium]
MAFTRSHHQVIAAALGCLDADALRAADCLFAGGTALAMRFGEYRESVDIGFVVADAAAYRSLREVCRQDGFDALTLPGQRVVTAGPLRIDQYGIRTRLNVTGVPVTFEIVREGRIALDRPGRADVVVGLATATLPDLVAMKLLANSDRWSDPTVFSRDIIDLAMVRPARPVLARGIAKAASAYGEGVVRDARSAITWLLERDEVVDRCRQALGMGQPRAVLVHQLRRLGVSLDAVSPAG